MIRRRFRFPVQLETPLQMRIVGMASFWPSRPNDEQRNKQRGIRIWSLQVQLPNNLFHPRVFSRAESLSTFGAESAVIGNVCSTVSTKHLLGPLSRLIKLERLLLARPGFGPEVVNPAY